MKGKDDPINNSRKPADWRIVIGKNPDTSKEVVNYGNRTNESVPPTVLSKTIEEDHNGHQSSDLNRSKVPKNTEFCRSINHSLSVEKKQKGSSQQGCK